MNLNLWRNLRYDLPLHFILVLTGWLPDNVVFIRLRGLLARPFFGKCGRKLGLGRGITFYNPSQIHIGNWVYIAKGCWFGAHEKITIEDEVLFGPYCIIASGNHIKKDNSFRFGATVNKPVLVGKGSWIGGHSTIVAGAVVGKGTVIGANTVVNKEIPASVLFAGNPGAIIKKV